MISDDERYEIYQRCFVCGIKMKVWSPALLSRCTQCYRKCRSRKDLPIPWAEWIVC